MDIILLVVTLVSIGVAALTSFIAWRLVRNEGRRSEARVAALASDIHNGFEPWRPVDPSARPSSSRATSRDDKLRVDLSFVDGRSSVTDSNDGASEVPLTEPPAALSAISTDLFAVNRSAVYPRPRWAAVM